MLVIANPVSMPTEPAAVVGLVLSSVSVTFSVSAFSRTSSDSIGIVIFAVSVPADSVSVLPVSP